MAIPYFVHPFSCGWMFGLFPAFGDYEKKCCEHSGTDLFGGTYVFLSGRILLVELLSHRVGMLSSSRNARAVKDEHGSAWLALGTGG